MKKLMIAVAAAAMIGGAFAEGYDFTATLKTTKGKMGKDSTTTYYLGRNTAGRMWYTAERVIGEGNNYLTNRLALAGVLITKQVANNTVPAIKVTNKGYIDFAADVPAELKDDIYADIMWAAAEGNYDQKSDGKWCETVKILTDAFCYRVAGSQKIKTALWQNGCCHDKWQMGFFGDYGEVIAYPTNRSFTVYENCYLLNRFGGDTVRKCNKVEIFARALFPQENDFQGYLAGQGSFKYDGEGPSLGYVTSISGNIVGTVAAPKCESCCLEELPIAEAWTCPDLEFTMYRSAAFGSFRLKYNRNY